MKIPSRVDGSVCGAVLSNRPAAGLRNIHTSGRSFCRAAERSASPPQSRPGRTLHCPQSSLWILSTFIPSSQLSCPTQTLRPRHEKSYSTAAAHTASSSQRVLRSRASPSSTAPFIDNKGQLLSLVRREDEGNVQEHFDFHRDPFRRGYAQPDGPKLQVSDKKRDIQYPQPEETLKTSLAVQENLIKLHTAIAQRLRHPHRFSLGPIYQLYSQLPQPRMLYLTWQWRNRLLRVMGTPRKRDMESMLRYFTLVADVKNAGLTLRRTHWNFALAFATKYAARATAQEMESALKLWREMEREAKVLGNDVTFNVLFDVASKAGNFTLAEMIYREMEGRGIEFNRFHHVSLIHYFGLKLDSGGIRAAYREMVESGEMVDTVALNCVISGLLRCGEESAAEETYQRMKDGYTVAPEMPQRDYMMNKVITRVLMMFSKVSKEHPQLKESLQTHVQLAPDLHTYKLLVEHYAVRVGNLTKVAQYLDEMKHLKISIHPTIFIALFKGFCTHGGFAGSDWSEQRLNGVLSGMYQARDESPKGFRIDRWLVIWALRAVQKCSTTENIVQTYDAMAQRWDIPVDRQAFINGLFENMLQNADGKNSRWKYVRNTSEGNR